MQNQSQTLKVTGVRQLDLRTQVVLMFDPHSLTEGEKKRTPPRPNSVPMKRHLNPQHADFYLQQIHTDLTNS